MRTLNEYFLTMHVPNASAAYTTSSPIPDGGVFKKAYVSIDKTFVGDETLTFSVGATTVGTLVMAASGSSNLSVFEFTPTESSTGDASVPTGGRILMGNNGNTSTTNLELNVVLVIRR